ncbi:CAP domain-containing protein [Deinococcus sp. HMF7620]|uniref:CAP domain-containing protein n=1 Tax=Deinococcus arboris TaxID=2682977 RepID=A0A7C9LPL8_9DEIO|nr:CAP domain-containing protein [Deinococcus arboris]MVN86041.1 CAP domain-containing protein [Deinococcus arboris]
MTLPSAWCRWLAALPLLLGGVGAQTALLASDQPVTEAGQFAGLVEADFLGCNQATQRDGTLDRVAGQVLRGFVLKTELQQAGYPAKRFSSFVLPKLGKAGAVAGALSGQCAHRAGFTRYGVSVQGGRAALVYVQPAQLDSAQAGTWLTPFLALTNEARRQGQRCGDTLFAPAQPLVWNSALAQAAQTQVNDMIRLNFRGHINPVTGSEPPERALASGYQGTQVGENAAYNALTPEEALRTLLDSPGHCRVLMNPEWVSFGAGLGNGTPGTTFSTY